jgi:hypothetical protein
MVLGVVFLVVSTALWTWQMRRLAVANPESRLPYIGWPPNEPPHVRILSGLAGGLMSVGAVLIANRADGSIRLWLFALCLLLVISVGVLPRQLAHNHRLPQ